jgi:cytidylate kinase
MIIAIDGVAASGKSTAAVLLAKKLGFFYINSGLLYRAVAYLVSKKYGEKYSDFLAEISFASLDALWSEYSVQYCFDGKLATVFINQENCIALLKSPFIDSIVSPIAGCSLVRDYVTNIQRLLAKGHAHTIIEGRDIASHVFPNADVKFFITADLSIRAQRWCAMQEKLGAHVLLSDAQKIIKERDLQDKTRSVGALIQTDDAIVIDTSLMTQEQTVSKMIDSIHKKDN